MPEYLAPGVYVEEVSFRAKSIEGVSTSTAGFVGATRTGPVGITPELVTSLGDFERTYGGLNDLEYAPNYLAHSVRAFFNEGGARLYVGRVLGAGAAAAQSAALATNGANTGRIVARFPGSGGNGVVGLRLVSTPVTVRQMNNAPEGTVVRIGGDNPAQPATLTSTVTGPYFLTDGSQLLLTVNGADDDITFRGQSAILTSAAAVADPVPLTPATNRLRVRMNDGTEQAIVLPSADTPVADVVQTLNEQLRGGFARLEDNGRLTLGTDRRGRAARIEIVAANAALGLTAQAAANTADANNNVDDLATVTAADINALLLAEGIPARFATTTGASVALSTTATGTGATIAVRDGATSAHSILGLVPASDTGEAGATPLDVVKVGNTWQRANGAPIALPANPDADPAEGRAARLTISLLTQDGDGNSDLYEDLALDSRHPRWLGTILAENPTRRAEALTLRYAFRGTGITAFDLLAQTFGSAEGLMVPITGGTDGGEPGIAQFEAALGILQGMEEISIVAAPGYSAYASAQAIQNALISHAERRRAYRIAVLDTPPGITPGEARELRGKMDSKYAALYYPWVVIANPLARPGAENIPAELVLPPSGFVAGIYARNDIERSVYKAPANEVVRSALRFESDVNFAQQEVLNPIGVNCLRYLEGRGYRVWGARTASSDPEWKYVNIRRYFNYLERSVDRGTQWAVFEPNGERLWANIRETVEAFLYNEWVSGALLGSSPKEAFFVRCDRSTMTQNDLDNGRLICLIGVAAIKPAEFVIFRIGQTTAESRS